MSNISYLYLLGPSCFSSVSSLFKFWISLLFPCFIVYLVIFRKFLCFQVSGRFLLWKVSNRHKSWENNEPSMFLSPSFHNSKHFENLALSVYLFLPQHTHTDIFFLIFLEYFRQLLDILPINIQRTFTLPGEYFYLRSPRIGFTIRNVFIIFQNPAPYRCSTFGWLWKMGSLSFFSPFACPPWGIGEIL